MQVTPGWGILPRMSYTQEEVAHQIREFDRALAVPCPEGMTKQITVTEHSAKLLREACDLVLYLQENCLDAYTHLDNDDVSEILEDHDFESEERFDLDGDFDNE